MQDQREVGGWMENTHVLLLVDGHREEIDCAQQQGLLPQGEQEQGATQDTADSLP